MRSACLFAAAALIAIAAPAIASAETVVPVDKFTAVDLHGGGRITIRQGPTQRVTLVRGDPNIAGFEVTDRDRGGRLVISSCKGFCWGSHHLDVEIETPALSGVAIHGGGKILAEGAFPAQEVVSASIHGGGEIDMKAVPGQSTSASIYGGGQIRVAAQTRLTAAIYGGGAIRYAGQPTVNSEIHGGGTISPLN